MIIRTKDDDSDDSDDEDEIVIMKTVTNIVVTYSLYISKHITR